MIIALALLVIAVVLVLLADGPILTRLAKIGGLFALLTVLLQLVRWLLGAGG